MAIKYTEEQLNTLDKSILVNLVLGLQTDVESLSTEISGLREEVHSVNDKMQLLMEQLILAKQNRFGRSSEKMDDYNQISFMEVDGNIVFFNEAEAVYEVDDEPEEITYKRKKSKGKKEADMAGLEIERVDHYLSDKELEKLFGPNGWKQLPDDVTKRYKFVPAKVMVEEHHVGVYSSKLDEFIIRAKDETRLLKHSPVTASLAAAIINAKYVNAVPLYRQEQEFARHGLNISRQNMAKWMIRLGESYISVFYDYLHKKIYDYHVIQADETPVLVNKDGRSAGSKSYMWVYRTGFMYKDKPIVLYEYQLTRNASHPRAFLKDYSGVCVTDGYQVYHTLDKEKDDLTVAGCWVHARRRFDEAQKVLPANARKGSLSYLFMKQIQAIYREEGKLKDLSSEERLMQRQAVVKPLVDAFFAMLKAENENVPNSGHLRDAVNYALNQEKYLKVFLTDGEVPIDNNASERAIRGFCIGKNYVLIPVMCCYISLMHFNQRNVA